MPTTVQSYEIYIVNGEDVTVLSNKGAVMTENNRKKLKYVNDKALVTITNIRGRCPGDKAARRLNDLQLQ
jgi:hypothetical protein